MLNQIARSKKYQKVTFSYRLDQNVWILHKRARSLCKQTAARSIVNIESKWRLSEKYGQNHICHHLSALEARSWTKTLRGPELTVAVS
jgi:hypothetical protein